MIFKETRLKGVYIIEMEPVEDDRGFFARTFCQKEFEAHRIQFNIAQCNTSYSKKKGTLRGMHYQANPHEEAKLIRCTRGAIYDVVVDLRLGSPTFKQWISMEISAKDHRLIYVPIGLAHGFQTLEDHTELTYNMSEPYHRGSARGIRWDDPAFGIEWPADSRIISIKDQQCPSYLL